MGLAGRSAQTHLDCPYCCAYEVDRLYVASGLVDSCECRTCGARWDEDIATGEFRGRADRQSALLRGPR